MNLKAPINSPALKISPYGKNDTKIKRFHEKTLNRYVKCGVMIRGIPLIRKQAQEALMIRVACLKCTFKTKKLNELPKWG